MLNYEDALSLSYSEYVDYLLQKYGPAVDDYFSEKSYAKFLNGEVKSISKKSKISRTSEGLYCHHIDENKQIMISTPSIILRFNIRYSYQTKDRLVYCNLIEHAILHLLITKESPVIQDNMKLGQGGYVNFIRPELNDWLILGNIPSSDNKLTAWRFNCYNAVKMDKQKFQDLLSKLDAFLIANSDATAEDLDFADQVYQNKKTV